MTPIFVFDDSREAPESRAAEWRCCQSRSAEVRGTVLEMFRHTLSRSSLLRALFREGLGPHLNSQVLPRLRDYFQLEVPLAPLYAEWSARDARPTTVCLEYFS